MFSNDEENISIISDLIGCTYKKSSPHNYSWTFKETETNYKIKTNDLFKGFEKEMCGRS